MRAITPKDLRDLMIVRCKDCKYYYANAKYCDAWGYIFAHWEWAEEVPEDGFCMYGERSET